MRAQNPAGVVGRIVDRALRASLAASPASSAVRTCWGRLRSWRRAARLGGAHGGEAGENRIALHGDGVGDRRGVAGEGGGHQANSLESRWGSGRGACGPAERPGVPVAHRGVAGRKLAAIPSGEAQAPA